MTETGEIINTSVYYLARDPKYDHEKPYETRYDTGGIIPQTNCNNEPKLVTVRSFRSLQNDRSFNDFGFSVERLDRKLEPAEFGNLENIRGSYYPSAERLLQKVFPGTAKVVFLEHGVRKRDTKWYPESESMTYETLQPASIAHVDLTAHSRDRVARAFKNAPKQWSRVLAVNLWKSFHRGNDWPLCLCDWRTVDHSVDTIAADVVHHDRYIENTRLFHNPKHEWYYFKDLAEDEVILFRQSDSEIEGGGGVPHTGFYNPDAEKTALPRESIELRAFLFFA